jgi:hypothetical protein
MRIDGNLFGQFILELGCFLNLELYVESRTVGIVNEPSVEIHP